WGCVPDRGLALWLAAAAAEAMRGWRRATIAGRISTGLAAGALVVWLAAGPPMLYHRGRLWVEAGRQAQAITAEVVALLPDPPPGATLVFREVPASYAPALRPANTGPYLLPHGLSPAARMRY